MHGTRAVGYRVGSGPPRPRFCAGSRRATASARGPLPLRPTAPTPPPACSFFSALPRLSGISPAYMPAAPAPAGPLTPAFLQGQTRSCGAGGRPSVGPGKWTSPGHSWRVCPPAPGGGGSSGARPAGLGAPRRGEAGALPLGTRPNPQKPRVEPRSACRPWGPGPDRDPPYSSSPRQAGRRLQASELASPHAPADACLPGPLARTLWHRSLLAPHLG